VTRDDKEQRMRVPGTIAAILAIAAVVATAAGAGSSYAAVQEIPSRAPLLNWIPFQNPAGGPYFGPLEPDARYFLKIDNLGDGMEDVAYRWRPWSFR
jgi:hypothetical protein